MTRRTRDIVFAVGALGFAALLAWGFAGLPDFGDFHGVYGHILNQVAPVERNVSEVVGATTFDYRGFDTLGEEFILFTAAVGVMALLRIQREEEEVAAEPAEEEGRPTGHSLSIRSLLTALVGPVLVLGVYIVLHGHLTPGGGFQGGVVLMTALLLAYLGGVRLSHGRAEPETVMELSEGLGAGGFALIGIGGLILGTAYLDNFLPFGNFGYLVSGGVIPLLNISVALEVAGATLVILGEFLDQRLLSRGGS